MGRRLLGGGELPQKKGNVGEEDLKNSVLQEVNQAS